MSSIPSEKPQEIYTILLLDANLRCTCDDVIRDESITQARGHYHHCMLWQVTRAIDISLRISEGHKFVYLSKNSGKFVK